MGYFKKHGIRVVSFWTNELGGSSEQLIYMLAYESLADSEKKWSGFLFLSRPSFLPASGWPGILADGARQWGPGTGSRWTCPREHARFAKGDRCDARAHLDGSGAR